MSVQAAKGGSSPLDILLYSALVPAGVAGSLLAVSGLALGLSPRSLQFLGGIGLALLGTLVVYTIDRLRDLERDRATAPARTRFVVTNRRALTRVATVSCAACLPLSFTQPPSSWGICAVALGLGLFHRRIKDHPGFANLYISAAWVLVVVGIPAAAVVPTPWGLGALTAGSIGCAIAANLIASESRGAERDRRTERRLRVAKGLALAGALVPLASPPLWPVCAIPLCGLASLIFFRPDERYGLGIVDGALLAGSWIALIGLLARN